MKQWRILLINKKMIAIKTKFYIIAFIFLLFLSIIPFANSYIQNFSYEHILDNTSYQQLDFDLIQNQLESCSISEYQLNCNESFDFSTGDYHFEYLNAIKETPEYELSNGFTLYKNCILYTNNEDDNVIYVFSYPKQVNFTEYFANSNNINNEELILKLFYSASRLSNLILIIASILWIMFVNRILLFVGFIIFPLVTKFIPKFKDMSLIISFKILVWSLSIMTIPFFLITMLFDNIYIFNLVYIYGLSLLIILNVLGLYTLNDKKTEERLDNKQYL